MRISARLLILEIFAFIAFVVLATAGFLAWRLSQGPIDLEFVRGQVERSLAEARGGQPVKIEKLALEWVRDRGRVEAVARGFTAMDKDNQVTFRADRAMIALDSAALLTFKVQPRQLRLENGTATVVRSTDGIWTLADMVIAKEPDASDKPFDPIRDINWTTLATPIRALISAGSFEQVQLADFHLDVDDRKSANVWSAAPVAGIWKANRDGVSLNLDITLADAIPGEPNRIRIDLVSDGKVERAAAKVSVNGVDPIAVAEMFGYHGDAFTSGRAASAVFAVSATERSGLLSTSLSLSGVTGSVKLADKVVGVRDLAFDAAYDPATKKITLNSLSVSSDWVSGSFKGEIDASAIMRGEPSATTPFVVSGADFIINAQPVFEAPWAFESATVEGVLSLDKSHLAFSRLEAVSGGLNASASGEVWLDTKGETLQLGLKGKALGTGVITPAQVLDFWPVDLSAGTRDWVRERITAGTANRAVFIVDWPPGANARGFLPDEHLSLEFDVQDASVKVLSDFPAITGVSGTGHLKGNSLTFDVKKGMMDTWQLSEARVDLPQFYPGGETMVVNAKGAGDLGALLRVVEQSQFGFASRYGIDVRQIRGVGSIDVTVRQPILDVVKPEDVGFAILGKFQGVALPNLLGDFGLAQTTLNLDLSPSGMTATGHGQFGTAPVTFSWRERSGANAGVELTAKARATPDVLNSLGFAARNFMQGEVDVDLRATGPGGRDFDMISANMDFTKAQLEFADFGWRKPYDSPARGSVRYGADGTNAIVNGDIRADGLEVAGEARMDKQGTILGFDLERLYARDYMDLRGSGSRRQDGGYRIALNGPYFDASSWMDGILDMSKSRGDAADGVGGPGEPGPVYDIQLNANRMKLRPDAEITNTRIALILDSEGPRSGTISGNIANGKAMNVVLGANNDRRNVKLTSDDAGFAARVLLKADYLIGGKLVFDGKFDGPISNALVTITDVRLKDAPLVAQIFSLASLQGLADVLSGEGVLFTDIHAPVRLVDGRIDLPGLRATGPAMGLTARGWIAPESGELSLDGVLAPSFIGANAVLGALPIIGDLFVSRPGEGMFAPTYSVRGTFARANISINPVAALTPGVLRRIFENPSEPPPTTPPEE